MSASSRVDGFASIAQWPMLRATSPSPSDLCGGHAILVQLRMVTSWVIDLYRDACPPEPSILHYLRRYCAVALKSWPCPQSYQFLEIALALAIAYVRTEDSQRAVFFIALGDSLPMKAARAIMAINRRYGCSQETGQAHPSGDAQLLSMLADGVLSATTRYLQQSAEAVEDIEMLLKMENVNGVDEGSTMSGMQYLEHALLQIASQECATPLIDGTRNLAHLFHELKSRALISKSEMKRVAAIWLGCKILNRVSDSSDSMAWSLILDNGISFLDIIAAMVESTSAECHSAAFSALSNTRVLHPQSSAHISEVSLEGGSATWPTTDQETELLRVDTANNPVLSLARLYQTITSDPSPLLQVILASSNPLHTNLVSASLAIISFLIDSACLKICISDFIYRNGCAEALASIAASDSDELIPVSARQSAIYLY
ncbi:hypothetical protein FRC02_007067 [Tulasnella sp. 418]|nr:hypothetical protein FRC02_007067 [Tulasnella sp. 418]